MYDFLEYMALNGTNGTSYILEMVQPEEKASIESIFGITTGAILLIQFLFTIKVCIKSFKTTISITRACMPQTFFRP